MRFNGQKIIKRLIVLILFLLCVGLNSVLSQITRPLSKKESTPALLAQASEAFSSGNLSEAETILQKVLSAEPRNAAAQTLAGIVADKENNLPKAERHLALAAKLLPNSPETRNNYGAILLRLKREKEAAREFSASLQANPNQPSALVNLAQIRFAAGKPEDLLAARDLFEKALRLAPDVEIARALVVISMRLNESERAARDYQEYASLAKEAQIPAAQRAELGAALLDAKLAKEAAAELDAAVALDAVNVESLVLLSRAFLKQKDIKSAGRMLESAVARGLDDARIYAALADVYEAGGYVENAIPAMRLAIEKDPKNEFYRIRYGLLLNDTSAPQAAIIRLTEATQEFPRSAKIRLALGIAQEADGKSADAQISFERALEIEPKSVPALAYLATVYAEKAQNKEAAALFERALAVEEKNAVLHYLLADTLLKISDGDPAQIERHLKRAIEIDDHLASAHLALGRIYARGERWQEAAAEFQKAVNFAPELAEAQYQLGRVLVRLKRTEESRVAFEKFKKLNETQTAQKDITRKELVRRLANTRF